MLTNGAVLWRTPHGLRIRRNRDGTIAYLTRHHTRYCDNDQCPTCIREAGDGDARTAAAHRRGLAPAPGTPIAGLDATDLDDLGPPPF